MFLHILLSEILAIIPHCPDAYVGLQVFSELTPAHATRLIFLSLCITFPELLLKPIMKYIRIDHILLDHRTLQYPCSPLSLYFPPSSTWKLLFILQSPFKYPLPITLSNQEIFIFYFWGGHKRLTPTGAQETI